MAYDKNTDYQKIINEAVAKGDYVTAAKAEQSRNEKIADMNASGTNVWGATSTNKYAGHLDTTDYGTIGKQQMASGAHPSAVLDTYNARYNKAANTVGLEQYANDAIQQEMWDYIYGYADKYNDSQPTYNSQYSAKIDQMLNQILNRDSFSYNAESDPLFSQYQAMYQREGNRAMNDTLASVAAGAGGMNSYAVTAAQQANDYYNAQLADKIPELYQLAYEMYLNDIDLQVQDLGLLQQMDNTQYNRYRDTMSDWRNDRDFAYNASRDEMSDYMWNKQFNYNANRDSISDQRYQDEFSYNAGRDTVADQQYKDELDYKYATLDADKKAAAVNQVKDLLELGIMPDDETLAAAGISKEEAEKAISGNFVVNGTVQSDPVGGGDGTGDAGNEEDNNNNGYVPATTKTPTIPATPVAPAGDATGAKFSNKEDAVAYMREKGVPDKNIAGLMTPDEWRRRKGSYEAYGQGGTEVTEYDTYAEYVSAYAEYCVEQYGS